MKYTMDKHRRTDGFTLVEMLLVLALFACLLTLLPFLSLNQHTMHVKMESLREQLLIVQGEAMRDLKSIRVDFHHTMMRYENHDTDIQMHCNGFVIFHPNGNVDHAKTLRCSYHNEVGELVIQLGSGRMYVKK